MAITRTRGSKDFQAGVSYNDGAEVVNNFDSGVSYPFNEIKKLSPTTPDDAEHYADDGNYWSRIPIFYVNYDVSGDSEITGREVSLYNINNNNWHLEPAFDAGDGKTYNYVDVGCYLLSIDESGEARSIPGVAPIKNSLSSIRKAIEKMNEQSKNYVYSL